MTLHRVAVLPVLAVVLLLSPVSRALATPSQYVETFATRDACDTLATTAFWDTTAQQLRIPPIPIDVVGGWDSPGVAMGVAVAGDHAFLADGLFGLQIVSIADPENPFLAGTYNTHGSAMDVAVAGNYAFVADGGSGLRIVNIADPTAPTAAGLYDTPGSAYAVVVYGDYAYVADGGSGLRIIDISNPMAPASVGTLDTAGDARDLVLDGDYIYMAAGSAGLQVISVYSPAAPSLRSTLDTPGIASGLAIAGNRILLADGTAGLHVIDISNPQATPVLLRTLDTPGTATNVAIDGDFAYVADANSTVQLVYMADPDQAEIRQTCEMPGLAYNLVVAGERAFVAANTGGLQVLEISRVCPALGRALGTTDFLVNDIILDGNYAFCASSTGGLLVVDVSVPTQPTEVGACTTGNATALDVAGIYAFVADDDQGLKIIDIRDPQSPVLAGSYTPTVHSHFMDVAVEGDYAYVAAGDQGIRVLNISNPTTPTSAGNAATIGPANAVVVDGDYAFVAELEAGTQVFNIANPATPVSLGICQTPGSVGQIAVDGDYVYAVDRQFERLIVIDVHNPASPTVVGSCDVTDATSVRISGTRAYVAGRGLEVVDISDPAQPVIVGGEGSSLSTHSVAVEGDYAYLGCHVDIYVVQVRRRLLALDENEASSLPVSTLPSPVLKVKMSTTQSGSIQWMVNGSYPADEWQVITPDGTWKDLWDLPGTGDQLAWRCTMAAPDLVNLPVCTRVELSWLTAPACITSIRDIPGDQGGRVRLSIARSGFDFADEAATPITGYSVWRRVDDPALRGALASAKVEVTSETGDLPLRRLGERLFLATDLADEPAALLSGTFPPGTWEALSSFLPTQQDEYVYPAPTLADSSTTIPWAVFCVTAHTAVPSVWYASQPDSGWSVDNIAPQVPANFAVAFGGNANTLSWDACPDLDFAYFRVYRGASDDVPLTPENLLHATTDSGWIDADTGGLAWYYKVTAVDDAENESGPASSGAPADVDARSLPGAVALHGNVPNPFSPATTIAFELAQARPVRLEIFDAAGHRIRLLLDETRQAGSHLVRWDGAGDLGQPAPAGVYFCRMDAGTFHGTNRMTLLR